MRSMSALTTSTAPINKPYLVAALVMDYGPGTAVLHYGLSEKQMK